MVRRILLGINDSGSVLDHINVLGRCLVDVSDRRNQRDLSNILSVNLEVSVCLCLRRFQDLLDCDRAKCMDVCPLGNVIKTNKGRKR